MNFTSLSRICSTVFLSTPPTSSAICRLDRLASSISAASTRARFNGAEKLSTREAWLFASANFFSTAWSFYDHRRTPIVNTYLTIDSPVHTGRMAAPPVPSRRIGAAAPVGAAPRPSRRGAAAGVLCASCTERVSTLTRFAQLEVALAAAQQRCDDPGCVGAHLLVWVQDDPQCGRWLPRLRVVAFSQPRLTRAQELAACYPRLPRRRPVKPEPAVPPPEYWPIDPMSYEPPDLPLPQRPSGRRGVAVSLYKDGFSMRAIAKALGVTAMTICRDLHNVTKTETRGGSRIRVGH